MGLKHSSEENKYDTKNRLNNMEQKDLNLLNQKGITLNQIETQMKSFKEGFPFLDIIKAAEIGDGIVKLDEAEQKKLLDEWDNYLKKGDRKVIKFVPASGAASRMFKSLFAFLGAKYKEPQTDFEKIFFKHIHSFAFFDDLNLVCQQNEGKDIDTLIQKGSYKSIIDNFLNNKGLDYGNLPKGLLKFHHYEQEDRTPLEEHLVEGALYATVNNKSILHFTVSASHEELFEKKVKSVLDCYEKRYGIKYEISYSIQKPSTETIAATPDNQPFRDDSGNLLFRPGGHGALIENLNDLEADIVFIKNIDNVVPDRIKKSTTLYKKLIAGYLVKIQEQTFDFLRKLDNEKELSDKELEEISRFSAETLNNKQEKQFNRTEQIAYLKGKLNRPIRVCGMVKNEGEPGGGPYLVKNEDGSVSPQILESSQINTGDKRSMEIMKTATHFNPVDLVCAIKDYKGNDFDLLRYVDKSTGFISHKSKNGKELKALELPGLWNGAMSNWNTIFMEVPISTFNPVKTVNDLLRPEHQ